MNRCKSVRRERIYVIGCLLMAVVMIGTFGAVERDLLTFGQGCWQTICTLIGGLICWNGIRLEESRTCRRRRRG